MKKVLKGTMVIMIVVSLALASCGGGGNDPKSLAKQAVELMEEMRQVRPGDAKFDAAMKKSAELEEKTGQLSEADRKIYDEEFARLMNR